MKRRDNYWMETFTGKQFWPLDPRPEDVCVEDIAHALSNICRFGGHCQKFYSVAEHSVWVSKMCDESLAPIGLFHDSAEAYLGDMIRPLKRNGTFSNYYKKIENRLTRVIFRAFGLDYGNLKLLGEIDGRMLMTEKNSLLIKTDYQWTEMQGRGLEPFALVIESPCSPTEADEAEKLFLDRFNELDAKVRMRLS